MDMFVAPEPLVLPRKPLGELYVTPANCTEALLGVESFQGRVWEPACGDGAIARVLTAAGLTTSATDLHDWGYGALLQDFLAAPSLLAPNIVTNPPFSLAEDFVRHAMDLGARKVCMFLRLAFLEGEARRQGLFAEHPPSRVWVMSRRRTLWRADDPNKRETGGTTAYAWFVWERGHKGAPVVGWLA
jgi:hypothetical protein